jgi:hypothetical protein
MPLRSLAATALTLAAVASLSLLLPIDTPPSSLRRRLDWIRDLPSRVPRQSDDPWSPPACNYPEAEEADAYQDQTIPRHIWLTYKDRESLPFPARLNLVAWGDKNPGWTVHLCDEGEAREALEAWGEEYSRAFDEAPLGVMRADLWRYAVLSRYGGACTCPDIERRLLLNHRGCVHPGSPWILLIEPQDPGVDHQSW